MAISKRQALEGHSYFVIRRAVEAYIDNQLCVNWTRVQNNQKPCVKIDYLDTQKEFPHVNTAIVFNDIVALYEKRGWKVTSDEKNFTTLIFS